jgi:hypothetical protein
MDKTFISGYFETIRILAIGRYLDFILFFKKLVNINGSPIKCAYQVFIIQNLDVLTFNP